MAINPYCKHQLTNYPFVNVCKRLRRWLHLQKLTNHPFKHNPNQSNYNFLLEFVFTENKYIKTIKARDLI